MEIGQQLNDKWEVVAIQEITRHGKYFSNLTVKARFYVRGNRGALFLGHLFTNGRYRIERSSTSFQSFFGLVEYDGVTGQDMPPVGEVVAALEAWTRARYGIGAVVTVADSRICFSVKTIYSATTLLRAFSRHRARVTAGSFMDYLVEVPLEDARKLLA